MKTAPGSSRQGKTALLTASAETAVSYAQQPVVPTVRHPHLGQRLTTRCSVGRNRQREP